MISSPSYQSSAHSLAKNAPPPELERGSQVSPEASHHARFRLRIAAEELMLRRPIGEPGRIARVLRKASIDLNPHQVDAAVVGLNALKSRGVILADEVGLGKTIEAGLILAQLFAEGRSHVAVLVPATLRKQWSIELLEKFGLPSVVIDGSSESRAKRQGARASAFDRPGEIVIASHPFAARRSEELASIPWDCVVLDEAHRLRGAHRGSKTARALRTALEARPKLLLTATPMQNGLGELYGLLSFLDPELLGPFDQFRRMYPDNLEGAAALELRERCAPFIHRTLRRQIREYVRYTARNSRIVEFVPTAKEQQLYQEVSDYLSEPDTLAIPLERRALMVLVYRKLLASSPAAIAGTLARLADGLKRRIELGQTDPELDSDAAELLGMLEDEDGIIAEDETPAETRPPATPSRLRGEAARLESMALLARSIVAPAKTEALRTALRQAFAQAEQKKWPKKAVIFTESRRTQDALERALQGDGHRVLLLHGGSGGAEERGQLVTDFRDHAEVLILTEAGAEGLNLQFCNLVINYDLPWNPQRIEQRIGRCHRYGQTLDVVVLNFLASGNAAEERLYELLSKKLELFDGVFGATDEILGSLGDGQQFERKVLEIFQGCREPTEIRRAFDTLQAELDQRIKARYAEAHSQICENFDDEVRARLGATSRDTDAALDRDENALVSLVRGAHPEAALGENGRLQIGDQLLETSRRHRSGQGEFLTVDHPIASTMIESLRSETRDIRYVLFDYTGGQHRISRLAPLLGSEGWWLVYRVAFEGALAEDHLVHVVLTKDPDGRIVVLDDEQVESLLSVTSREIEKRPRLKATTLASTHSENILEGRVLGLSREVRARAEREMARLREAVDAGLEDSLEALRRSTAEAQSAWHKARIKSEPDARALFRELQRALDREAIERKRALTRRAERHAELDRRTELNISRSVLATAYFWIE